MTQYQQRVLLVGVLIALVLRTIFIAASAAIISNFAWVFYRFGAFLIYTAWKLIEEALGTYETLVGSAVASMSNGFTDKT